MPFWTLRRAFGAAAVLALSLAVGWAAVVLAVAVEGARDQATTADAIVVLGAAQYNGRPSPVFRARLDHAAALYQRGLAPVVLVTGGVGAGEVLSEANVGRDYLARRRIYSGRVVHLDVDSVRYPDGSTGELEMLRHPGAAAVIPFASDPRGADPTVLLIKQYRYATGGSLFEIPAGRLDPGEEPE